MTSRPAIISYHAWENVKCKTNNHVPLVVPSVQATEQQTKVLDERITEIPEWLQPFTEGFTRRSSSSTGVSPAVRATSSNSSFRTSSSKTYFKQIRRKAQCIHSFSQEDANCEVCRRTNVMRAPCKTNLADRGDRVKIAERYGDMIPFARKQIRTISVGFQRATPHRTHIPRPQRHTQHNTATSRSQGQRETERGRER